MVWFPMSYERIRRAIDNRRSQKALMSNSQYTNPSDYVLAQRKISRARYNAMVKLWNNSNGNIDYHPDIFDRY